MSKAQTYKYSTKIVNNRNISTYSLSPKAREKKTKLFTIINRFSGLAERNDVEVNTPIINVQIRNSDDTTKLPPVHIKNVCNISTIISRLDSTDFICKSTPSYLIVLAHFREQYNLLLTYL